jgi:IS5 family transposase
LKGGIALLILKYFTGLSDEMLIDCINTDWCMQMFCGIQLKPHEQIRDKNLPSSWRGYMGGRFEQHQTFEQTKQTYQYHHHSIQPTAHQGLWR